MKPELARLQGTWKIVALELEGRSMPQSGFTESSIVIQGNRFTTISMGAPYGGTLKADDARSPKTPDLSFKAAPEKGNASRPIYGVDGDTSKLCPTVTVK